ncbi:MAG: hypothetical protein H6Q17_555 [Bacteroidetes bacterium]|nr:hypothetical protein [Bacteroidota bacterium]
MATYKIEHDEVTGINGARYLKDQEVDSSVFHETAISGLIQSGAITLVKQKSEANEEVVDNG